MAGDFLAGHRHQTMADAQVELARDEQGMSEQQVVRLVDRAGLGVFRGHHRTIGAPGRDRVKDITQRGARESFRLAKELCDGLLAVRASLTLKGNTHPKSPLIASTWSP